MELIIITIGIIALAYWQKSYVLSLLGGTVAVGFGIYWITVDPGFIYLLEGIVSIAIGVFMVIMVGVDLLKGE